MIEVEKNRTAWLTVAQWAAQFHAALRPDRAQMKIPRPAHCKRGILKSFLLIRSGLLYIFSSGSFLWLLPEDEIFSTSSYSLLLLFQFSTLYVLCKVGNEPAKGRGNNLFRRTSENLTARITQISNLVSRK